MISPGYSDPKSLVFRDETKSVIKKVTGEEQHSLLEPLFLLPHIEDHAKVIFISQYVVPERSTFSYIPVFYPPTPDLTIVHLSRSVSNPVIIQQVPYPLTKREDYFVFLLN